MDYILLLGIFVILEYLFKAFMRGGQEVGEPHNTIGELPLTDKQEGEKTQPSGWRLPAVKEEDIEEQRTQEPALDVRELLSAETHSINEEKDRGEEDPAQSFKCDLAVVAVKPIQHHKFDLKDSSRPLNEERENSRRKVRQDSEQPSTSTAAIRPDKNTDEKMDIGQSVFSAVEGDGKEDKYQIHTVYEEDEEEDEAFLVESLFRPILRREDKYKIYTIYEEDEEEEEAFLVKSPFRPILPRSVRRVSSENEFVRLSASQDSAHAAKNTIKEKAAEQEGKEKKKSSWKKLKGRFRLLRNQETKLKSEKEASEQEEKEKKKKKGPWKKLNGRFKLLRKRKTESESEEETKNNTDPKQDPTPGKSNNTDPKQDPTPEKSRKSKINRFFSRIFHPHRNSQKSKENPSLEGINIYDWHPQDRNSPVQTSYPRWQEDSPLLYF